MSLCIAIPAYDGKIPVETAVHLIQSVGSLQRAGVAVDVQWGSQSALIDLCRNRLVKKFLTQSTADRMLFLDSDIIFQTEDLLHLYLHSAKYPVVGAVYPVRKDPPKFFMKAKNNVLEVNEDGLIEVEGFGAGLLIIHRDVFKALDDKVEEFEDDEGNVLKRYFDIRIVNRRYKGEDISFIDGLRRWRVESFGRELLAAVS